MPNRRGELDLCTCMRIVVFASCASGVLRKHWKQKLEKISTQVNGTPIVGWASKVWRTDHGRELREASDGQTFKLQGQVRVDIEFES